MQLVYGIVIGPEEITEFRANGIEIEANGFFGSKLSKNSSNPIKIDLSYYEDELDSKYYSLVEKLENLSDVMDIIKDYTPELMVIQ